MGDNSVNAEPDASIGLIEMRMAQDPRMRFDGDGGAAAHQPTLQSWE